MYRTVHSWVEDELPVVVEDEDGIRLLLIEGSAVAENVHRTSVVQFGAQAVISMDDDLPRFSLFGDELRWHDLDHPEFPYYPYVELIERAEAPTQFTDQFVNLHTHTEFSPMDGLNTVGELVAEVVRIGQPALGSADHGNCASHPKLQKECAAAGIKPIFGFEAYLVDDRFFRPGEDDEADQFTYWHLCLWATDNDALLDLWAASTESYRDGFYGKPRLDWSTLERLGSKLLCGTGCLGGPVADPLKGGNANDLAAGDPETARANLARLHGIFGDRLYVELHTNQQPIQRAVNEWLVVEAGAMGIAMIASADAHYCSADDASTQQVWLAVTQNDKTVEDISMFRDGPHYHLHTAAQARAALAYLGEDIAAAAVAETVRAAERCSAEIVPQPSTPTFSRPTQEWPDPVAHDEHRLRELVERNWTRRIAGKPYTEAQARARLDQEMPLYVSKGYCGYMLMLALVINWTKDQGIMVGPGRGSAPGSFVLFLCGLSEIDPLEHDLLIERFITEGRTSLPDVDTDFPSTHKATIINFVRETWGPEHVVTVGTHTRLRNKGAVRNTAQAIKHTLPEGYFYDIDKVSNIIDQAEASSAGLGISWEKLWAQHDLELEPYREKYPELFELAELLVGRLKTYSRHAAGVVIDPEHSIEDALPLRNGQNPGDPMITQFDMEALEWLGYVKFDFLNLRTLDTLQQAVDLVARDTGFRIDFSTWNDEYRDPEVFDILSAGWTKGVFQIETRSGTRMTTRFGPQSLAELADVITLVRPGPMNSGLTEKFLERRSGADVTFDDPRLKEALAKSYGLMIYQEDIMKVCQILAGYSLSEADEVRSILGKKKVEKVVEAGKKFVSRAVENGLTEEQARSLWTAMAEFAKYSFNRSHAFSYATLGYWCAWMIVHYPVQMICALLSTVDKDDIPDFVEEARRLGITVQPPDINESGVGFNSTTEGVRYGLQAIKGIGDVAAAAVIAARAGGPFTSYQNFLERRSTDKVKSNVIKLLAEVGAFDSIIPENNRRWLLAYIEAEAMKSSSRCRWLDLETPRVFDRATGGPPGEDETVTLPCTFDWVAEPPEYGKPNTKGERKPKKRKPLPKKCTAGCRQFNPVPPPSPEDIRQFTDGDIGEIEGRMLGVRLSTTEFDRIPDNIRRELTSAERVISSPLDLDDPDNNYFWVAALVRSARKKKDQYGRQMAFLSLTLENGGLHDIVMFSSIYDKYGDHLSYSGLVYAILKKTDRGLQLVQLDPA